MVALALAVILALPQAQGGPAPRDDACARALEAREWELAKGFVNRTYDVGAGYYHSGYRKEAAWFFQRTLDLVPKNLALRRFVDLIQDYDNPVWKKKRWRHPKAGVEGAFRRQAAAWDEEYARFLLQMGRFAAGRKDDACRARAKEYYVRLLRHLGGPLEIGPDRCLKAGKAGTIPEPYSAEIARDHVVRINGLPYLRDAMLEAIPDVQALQEARGKRALVRTLAAREVTEQLLRVLEQAVDHYAAHTKQEALRPLGLFVFADRAGYERFCRQSGNTAHLGASGFASAAEGFAVTYAQPALEEVAVHEGAHLFHYMVYRSNMPSWYDEGFACTFGHAGTMRWAEGRLETGLPLERARLEALARGGTLPLKDLLHGSAIDRINAADGSGATFYAQSWALYTFLRTTKDPRFAGRFETWEGFCLGAGYDKVTEGTRSVDLFDRIFAEVLGDLEQALKDWIGAQAGAAGPR